METSGSLFNEEGKKSEYFLAPHKKPQWFLNSNQVCKSGQRVWALLSATTFNM